MTRHLQHIRHTRKRMRARLHKVYGVVKFGNTLDSNVKLTTKFPSVYYTVMEFRSTGHLNINQLHSVIDRQRI